jgi:hypothetical protein
MSKIEKKLAKVGEEGLTLSEVCSLLQSSLDTYALHGGVERIEKAVALSQRLALRIIVLKQQLDKENK